MDVTNETTLYNGENDRDSITLITLVRQMLEYVSVSSVRLLTSMPGHSTSLHALSKGAILHAGMYETSVQKLQLCEGEIFPKSVDYTQILGSSFS